MIRVIDYGVGNLGSIINMFKKIGVEAKLATSIEDIEKAEKLLLPGVGAFDSGMNKLLEKDFVKILNYKVQEQKIPILGICLGMQLMTRSSTEGILPGLGWFDAQAVKFNFVSDQERKLKVPHMGWNFIKPYKESVLLKNMYEDAKFYFVHSYYITCNVDEDVLIKTNYNFDFVSAIERGNIFGVQFHPEKSHKYGMKLLKNFSEL